MKIHVQFRDLIGKQAANFGALGLAIVFCLIQISTLDYGTTINDQPHIRDHKVSPSIVMGSALDRANVVVSQSGDRESIQQWMLRFKLYTVEADEVYSVIALARMRPDQFQFDPHYYQYGGAFLYPLGGYFFGLSKIGAVSIGSLDAMLSQPNKIDAIWISGRALIVATTAAAGLLLYFALSYVSPPKIGLLGLAIFYFCPATIMFSQMVKPHWYALLFSNAALWIAVRAWAHGNLTSAAQLGLGIAIGLAVGSVITFSLFAFILWCGLLYLCFKKIAAIQSLVVVPAVAILAFLISNPYFLLNWPAVADERAQLATWYTPAIDLAGHQFVYQSVMPGFGVATTIAFASAFIFQLARPTSAGIRLLGLGILFSIVTMTVMLAGYYYWHVNFRYVSYTLPMILLFLAAAEWPFKQLVLALTAFAAVVQAVPLKLAYLDENSAEYSTRLRAARTIDDLPEGDAICINTGTPAPFSLPPFRFDRRRTIVPGDQTADCRWLVVIDGNREPTPTGEGWEVANRFAPRLSPLMFPLVWEHVNPRISIFRKKDSHSFSEDKLGL